ncbi:MAG: SGNH/GDSL hydrolase family protein [Cyclobacterium sp.]|uniref:SGNH/GDSL hydrolase family protein n=1 Tax=Cyclobacterium sp. TaxID=1966343 RepID=UPI0039707FF5
MKIGFLSNTLFLLFISIASLPAQEQLVWFDPLESGKENIVHGKAGAASAFSRLPDSLMNEVREPVWRLSRQAAGLKLKFSTDAKKITVRYTVSGTHGMPHMPATGVSGLDLYSKNEAGQWIWVKGNYSFADTIQYEFLINDIKKEDKNFDLYLPLYNEVLSMEVGIPGGATLDFLSKDPSEKPIVVYGTSIAQGACASRPGMAWTAILERKVNHSLINLGFSGNGQLEEPLIEYMAGIESSLYILDCLPNLVRDTFGENEVKNRISNAVRYLKEKRPDTPIILVAHAGYTDDLINMERKSAYQKRNIWSIQAYKKLINEGFKGIYYLDKDAIGLEMDATVDGTHPSDLGMDQYAIAYAALVKEILK